MLIYSIAVAEDGKHALLTLSNGDMRKVLNVLQSTWLAYKEVTEETVYTCVGHPLKRDIENIIKWLLNDDFQTTYKSRNTTVLLLVKPSLFFVDIQKLKVIKGLALNDILTEVHTYVHRSKFYVLF